MRCSDGQSLAAQQKFGTCSHAISGEAYNRMGEEDYEEGEEESEPTVEELAKVQEETAKVLCETLVKIGVSCMKELQTCFRRDDVVRTTTSHLTSMKGYLVTIAGAKVRKLASFPSLPSPLALPSPLPP
jgi:hypothetical protein